MFRKIKATKPVAVSSLLVIFVFIFTSVVVAVGNPIKLQNKLAIATNQSATASASKKTRLNQVKLKVCQKKQSTIQTRSQNLVRRANLIMSLFDKVTTRVEQYYTNKLVPESITIANYDQMVANLATNKTAVQTALTNADTDAKDFSCSGDDPKGQLRLFRQDMVGVIRALNNYKKSVINLLVTVRTKAKNVKSPTATPSATP